MQQADRHYKQERAKHLVRLARALYESAVLEEDGERIKLHGQVAGKLTGLINEAINEDHTLDPDLGLDLLLFVELKESMLAVSPEQQAENAKNKTGISGVTPGVVADQGKYISGIIKELEAKYGIRES